MTATTLIKAAIGGAWIWLGWLLMPVQSFLVFTMVLVLCDFVTGIRAARHRGEALQSKGFSRTVWKITLYCMGILLSHGMDLVFFAPKGLSFDLVWMVAGIIGLTEFKSNLENIAVVTGTDIWSLIAEKIPGLPKFKK